MPVADTVLPHSAQHLPGKADTTIWTLKIVRFYLLGHTGEIY